MLRRWLLRRRLLKMPKLLRMHLLRLLLLRLLKMPKLLRMLLRLLRKNKLV